MFTNGTHVYDVLAERGYIAQVTDADAVRDLLSRPGVTFYIGFDPTADSLHVGHLLQLMVMAHMQRAGHRPIAILGVGTAMVGDPSGKCDMRRMLTQADIEYNAGRFRKQMERLVDFRDGRALMASNGDWLLGLNYIAFLRDIGAHFSVNRMLTADCYRQRMEHGLTFLEFNYMIMQSYDFLHLYRAYGCRLQLGGDDQWSNILGGIDLIRRKDGGEAYGMTFRLLTTGDGRKMGKTERGALWLDPERTSPYEFHQYWRNVDDADVANCLRLLTFLPMDRVRELSALQGEAVNEAKKVLAYEVTALVHGEEAAREAERQAEALFGGAGRSETMPTTVLERTKVAEGVGLLDVLAAAGLVSSKSEGRRLIAQGGLTLNGEPVTDPNRTLEIGDFPEGAAYLRKGKKIHHRVVLE